MKPNLRTIRRTTTITTEDLARQSHLPLADVVVVEVGGYTSHEKAQQVIGAFNRLSGLGVRLDDIRIHCQEHPQ